MPVRKHPVNLFLKVVGRSRGTEGYACDVLLVVPLKLLGFLCGVPYAYQKYSCSKRIQCACMAYLQVLFPEMPDSRKLYLPDDIG